MPRRPSIDEQISNLRDEKARVKLNWVNALSSKNEEEVKANVALMTKIDSQLQPLLRRKR